VKEWQARDITGAWADFEARALKASPHQHTAVHDVAHQLARTGNPVFQDTPLEHAVVIPSGGSSARFLGAALNVVVDQAKRTCRPPATVVSVNYTPDDENGRQQALQNITTIHETQQRHPRFPLSYAVVHNWPEKPIGTIRDEAIVGTLALHAARARQAGQPMSDMLITSMDSDALAASRLYLPRTQAEYDRSTRPGFMTGPFTRHQALDASFRAANILINWYDLESLAGLPPANFSINATAYMAADGLAGYVFVETSHLLGNAGYALREDFQPSLIKDQTVYNSAHNLVRLMNNGKAPRYGAKKSGDVSLAHVSDTLPADLEADYFNTQLADTVTRTSRSIFDQHAEKLAIQGMGSERFAHATRRTNRVLRAAAFTIGHAHKSRDIIAQRLTYYPVED
jgi:hypothetical protein